MCADPVPKVDPRMCGEPAEAAGAGITGINFNAGQFHRREDRIRRAGLSGS